jgi:hypothetical protein
MQILTIESELMEGGTNLTNTEKQLHPIPMNPSGDDIDDVHHMTLQPNLSWSLIGETSPLGEVDGIDPLSSAIPMGKKRRKGKIQEGHIHYLFRIFFCDEKKKSPLRRRAKVS